MFMCVPLTSSHLLPAGKLQHTWARNGWLLRLTQATSTMSFGLMETFDETFGSVAVDDDEAAAGAAPASAPPPDSTISTAP